MNAEKLTLGPIDIEYLKNQPSEASFVGSDISTMGTYDYNKKLSRSLLLNGKIIGYILLKKASILLVIRYIIYYIKDKTYSDLRLFVSRDYLRKYLNKRGTYITRIYIAPYERGHGYGDILIKYANELGDYTWGISVGDLPDKYWIPKQDRIKILTYADKGTSLTVTSTKI